jgi:hypothetical protein
LRGIVDQRVLMQAPTSGRTVAAFQVIENSGSADPFRELH